MCSITLRMLFLIMLSLFLLLFVDDGTHLFEYIFGLAGPPGSVSVLFTHFSFHSYYDELLMALTKASPSGPAPRTHHCCRTTEKHGSRTR